MWALIALPGVIGRGRTERDLGVDLGDLARHVGPVEAAARARRPRRRAGRAAARRSAGARPSRPSDAGSRERKRRPDVLVRARPRAGRRCRRRCTGSRRPSPRARRARTARRSTGTTRQVGDPVERVQHVVADPAEERAVLVEAELGRPGARSSCSAVPEPATRKRTLPSRSISAGQRLERELEALLVDEPARPAARASRRAAAKRARSVSRSSTGMQVGRVDPVRDHGDRATPRARRCRPRGRACSASR